MIPDGMEAVGAFALSGNVSGVENTAVGDNAGVAVASGSNDTFMGAASGFGSSTQQSNATAIGPNAAVGESNALVLGGVGQNAVNVGIGATTPSSLLQVGAPSTSYGKYLQLPLVTNQNAPPAAQCNATTFVGRVVMQYNPTTRAESIWGCSSAGKWSIVHWLEPTQEREQWRG